MADLVELELDDQPKPSKVESTMNKDAVAYIVPRETGDLCPITLYNLCAACFWRVGVVSSKRQFRYIVLLFWCFPNVGIVENYVGSSMAAATLRKN